MRTVWLVLRRGAFACVGWRVTLCDPMQWVLHKKLYRSLTFFKNSTSYPRWEDTEL